MQRTIYARATGVANSTMTALFDTPRVGQTWTVLRVGIRSPNWTSGTLAPTRILLQGREMAASQQGQADVAGGDPITVHESEQLSVMWTIPANVSFLGAQLIGIAEAIVEQAP